MFFSWISPWKCSAILNTAIWEDGKFQSNYSDLILLYACSCDHTCSLGMQKCWHKQSSVYQMDHTKHPFPNMANYLFPFSTSLRNKPVLRHFLQVHMQWLAWNGAKHVGWLQTLLFLLFLQWIHRLCQCDAWCLLLCCPQMRFMSTFLDETNTFVPSSWSANSFPTISFLISNICRITMCSI